MSGLSAGSPGQPPFGLGDGLGALGPGDPLQILLGLPSAEGFGSLLHRVCGDLGGTMAVGPQGG